MQISGLSSGIDTSTMVQQLMSVERLAGNSLTKGRTNSQALVSAYTSLNSAMKKIGDAAQAFVPASVTQTAAWSAVSSKSSNPAIAGISTTDKAQAGSLTFSVERLAQAGAAISGTSFTSTDEVNEGKAFDFHVTIGDGAGAKSHKVSVGPNSRLADVVAAINQQTGGDVKATMVQIASGTHKLQVTSGATGANTDVNVTNGETPPLPVDVLGEFAKVAEGKDTLLRVGDATNGYNVTSSTRDVTNLLPGVTINPVKASPGEQVTVDITTDVAGMASKVSALVSAANDAVSNIRINSGYNKDNPSLSGPFLGNATTRDLTNRITGALTAAGLDPSAAGISVDKSGTITFDQAKFTEAYGQDAEKVQGVVNTFAGSLSAVSKQASDANNGTIAVAIRGEQSMIEDYGDRIKAFEERMTAREATLNQQFKAMETMLSKMQAQGNWLNGQLTGLYANMG